ncbi:MAG: hypothetical protein IAE91_11035 [Ignavibacteriaceae bacterium]|nr:hypothetical protein [Ignavibacteriaceae bacterium]
MPGHFDPTQFLPGWEWIIGFRQFLNKELRTTNYEQRTTNKELRTTNYEQRTTNKELRTKNYEQRT